MKFKKQPMKSLSCQVDMKLEIEPTLRRKHSQLHDKFIKRVIVFTLSGTCIVDLKSETSKESLCARLNNTYLTGFLCQLVLQRRKYEEVPYYLTTANEKHSKEEPSNITLSEQF